ncbi:hypothetical protein K439DRAFT_821767 [Ramaria rubella]|nr:hypothetical protein K439DRAFT_821767 [Ramaria rubella]
MRCLSVWMGRVGRGWGGEGRVRKEHGARGGGRDGRFTYAALLTRWCFHTSWPGGAGAGDDATPRRHNRGRGNHQRTRTTSRRARSERPLPRLRRRLVVRGLPLRLPLRCSLPSFFAPAPSSSTASPLTSPHTQALTSTSSPYTRPHIAPPTVNIDIIALSLNTPHRLPRRHARVLRAAS